MTKGLFNVNVATSPIGSFKLNQNGDTNAGEISVYQIKGGQAVFKQVISLRSSRGEGKAVRR